MTEIAKADASTAWCLCQSVVCSMAAAYLAPEVAREVFGDPRAVLCWGPPTHVEALEVAGGWRLSGNFTFASGGHHATWMGAAAPLFGPDGKQRRRADGSAELRTFLVPASEVTWTEVWQVTGLCGTGSDSYAINDAFVPVELTVFRDEPSERREPGRLYHFS